jgi:hypothetical protein
VRDDEPVNPDSQDTTLRKVTLNGIVLGKFDVPGKEPGQFSAVHGMDCRNGNEMLIDEIIGWRVQKLILHPSTSQGGKK